MFFVEDKVDLSEHQKEFIDFVIDTTYHSVPFYCSVSTENRKTFSHCLMSRDINDIPEEGKVDSNYFFPFLQIFHEFCVKHSIRVTKVLRAAVNYSIYYEGLVAGPHVDHDFDHCNFLLYLTDCKGGNTLILDEDDNIIKSIPPKKYKAVVFPGLKHAIEEFEPGEDRFVVVFTFIKD